MVDEVAHVACCRVVMGGKLFNLPRMPRDPYLEVEASVRRHLDERLPGQYRIPRYYGDKPDFGDMDVLVVARPDWDEVRAGIVRDLGITETRAVGHVYSTVYQGLQTDFFSVPEPTLDSAYTFMCFNDLGNFIGRICRRFDLKYGEKGLSYVYRRAGGNYTRDLEVTRDFARTCAFLGLDHAGWVAGFASLPAMFEWVIEPPGSRSRPTRDEVDNRHLAAPRRGAHHGLALHRVPAGEGRRQAVRLRGSGGLSAPRRLRVPRGRSTRADRARAGGRGTAGGARPEVQREAGDAARPGPGGPGAGAG